MKFSEDKEKELMELAIIINRGFWEHWHMLTEDFPDTQDGDLAKFLLSQDAICLISNTYITGFESIDARLREKNHLIFRISEFHREFEDAKKRMP